MLVGRNTRCRAGIGISRGLIIKSVSVWVFKKTQNWRLVNMGELKLPGGMRISLAQDVTKQMQAREMFLYSEKVEPEDMHGFFEQMSKARMPFLGFLDLSGILSLNSFKIIVKRDSNTVSFYTEEKKHLEGQSALAFPFRLGDKTRVDVRYGASNPLSKFYALGGGRYDFLDFMLKENIEELELNISKVLGKFIAAGAAIDTKGKKRAVTVFGPHKFFRINLEEKPSVYIEVLDPLPKKKQTASNFPVFEDTGQTMGVDNYDPMQHTLVVGTSGSGKSKALYVLLKAIEHKYGDDARIIIVDPHGEFCRMFPHNKQVDFVRNYVEPLDVGGQKSPMMTQLVAQLLSSSVGDENKYSERVLFYAVHLLSGLNQLELGNISSLLTEPTRRAEYLSTCENDEVKRFFDEEYNDIYIHHFNSAILPILNFIGEYELYMGKEKKLERLYELVRNNKITVVSFDPKFFGRKMIRFLSGAIINQMYLLAITGKLMDKKTILVMDEFPRIETKVAKDILAETRKFNMFAYFSCQYLGQLNKEILDSIVSNARNIIAFKLNRQDAALLSSVMEIKLEEYFKKRRAQAELEESKKEMFIRLNQRECIARLFDGKNYLIPMKLKVVDAHKWGFNDNMEVDAKDGPGPNPPGSGGPGEGPGGEGPGDGGISPFAEQEGLPEPMIRDDELGKGGPVKKLKRQNLMIL